MKLNIGQQQLLRRETPAWLSDDSLFYGIGLALFIHVAWWLSDDSLFYSIGLALFIHVAWQLPTSLWHIIFLSEDTAYLWSCSSHRFYVPQGSYKVFFVWRLHTSSWVLSWKFILLHKWGLPLLFNWFLSVAIKANYLSI